VGESVTLAVQGLAAGEGVGVTLHSTPQTLSPATASSAGVITYSFTVPADLEAGTHSVVFLGATSGMTTTWTFSLVVPDVEGTTTTNSGSLPFTGANAGREVVLAVAALWSGLILLLSARLRRPVFDFGGRHRATGARHRQSGLRRPE